MRIFDKWFMRASGEKKHQPSCPSEARVRSSVSELLTHGWFKAQFEAMSDEDKSNLFDQLLAADVRATENY